MKDDLRAIKARQGAMALMLNGHSALDLWRSTIFSENRHHPRAESAVGLFPDHALGPVIGGARKHGGGAVNLLKEHDPHQLVRPRRLAESKLELGARQEAW